MPALYGVSSYREVVMPLYLIKIYRSGNPGQQVIRPYQAADIRAARTKAITQLDVARNTTRTGRHYDSWAVLKQNPLNGKFIELASSKSASS